MIHPKQTEIMCTGCGRTLEHGEPLFEVARLNFYCTYCVLPGVAADCPIVGDEVLVKTAHGYDSALRQSYWKS